MITLSDKIISNLESEYRGFKIRSDKVLYKTSESNVVVPSKLYPLSNKKKIQLFTHANTKKLDDNKAKTLFNNTSFSIGRCYQNTRDIYNILVNEGYEDLEMYVGWLFNGGLPIHHCWLVYKGTHVLDGSVGKQDSDSMNLLFEKFNENPNMTKAEMREIQAHFFVEQTKLPHSETKTFGQVVPYFIYTGTPCSPEEGRKIYRDLIATHPNHPAYSAEGMNSNGASKTQKLIDEELKSMRQSVSK